VSSPPQTTPQSQEAKITFACSYCGSSLTISAAQAGVSGPCPVCRAPIQSPALELTPKPPPSATEPTLYGSPDRPAKDCPIRSKVRIPPDSIVDHAHLENRESIQTVKVLALFILTACACLAAAWFLKDHLSR
jgi:hypothetical protein